MALSLILGLRLDSAGAATAGAAAIAGSAATTIASMGSTPAVHYHFPTATATSSGSPARFTAVTDRMGLADISEGAAGTGALDRTDTQGLRVASFTGLDWMAIANGLVTDTRATAVFMVARVPHCQDTHSYISHGRNGDGKATTGAAILSRKADTLGSAHIMANNISTKAATGHANMIPGAQIQVIGVNSRPTASGGQRLYINTNTADIAQIPVSITGFQGMEIARWAFNPGVAANAVTGAGGAWGEFDLYELMVFTGVLSNAQSDAIASAIATNWGCDPITNQVVLEGDSLTRGIRVTPGATADINGYQSLGALLTDRGSAYCLPRNTRLVNLAVGGNKIAQVIARRDQSNTLYAELLGGTNKMAVHIGTNDAAAADSGATMYAATVAMWNTTTTGILQRGWTGLEMLNIARSDSGTTNQRLVDKRALIRAAQFFIDTSTDGGGAFPGKITRVELPLIAISGGNTPFNAVTDPPLNLTYYQGDGLHESALGAAAWVSGDTTPSNGYFANL